VKGLISQARRLRDQGKTKQALDLYGQVLTQAPANAEAHAGRGWCYLELSQYAQAEAAFQTALESDSSSADGLLGLAETFRYEGRRADAVRFYERYLVEHPDGEDAVAAQNAIKSLKE
jgi:tetratricopeptide (TPR) repeat protein